MRWYQRCCCRCCCLSPRKQVRKFCKIAPNGHQPNEGGAYKSCLPESVQIGVRYLKKRAWWRSNINFVALRLIVRWERRFSSLAR